MKKDKNGSDDGSEDPPASPVKAVKGATKQTWGSKPKGTVGKGKIHARGRMRILILTHALIVLSPYLPFLTIFLFFISSLCFVTLLFDLIYFLSSFLPCHSCRSLPLIIHPTFYFIIHLKLQILPTFITFSTLSCDMAPSYCCLCPLLSQ